MKTHYCREMTAAESSEVNLLVFYRNLGISYFPRFKRLTQMKVRAERSSGGPADWGNQ